MRTVTHHAEPFDAGMFPGLASADRIMLEQSIREAIRGGLKRGVHWPSVVLHVQADGAEIVDREELVALLRRVGVRELVQQLRAAVPRGKVLAYLDFEGASWSSITSIAGLLGEEASHA